MKNGACYSCGETGPLPIGIGDFDICKLCAVAVARKVAELCPEDAEQEDD
jgi:hypothetical protein